MGAPRVPRPGEPGYENYCDAEYEKMLRLTAPKKVKPAPIDPNKCVSPGCSGNAVPCLDYKGKLMKRGLCQECYERSIKTLDGLTFRWEQIAKDANLMRSIHCTQMPLSYQISLDKMDRQQLQQDKA